jgi:hypothetical protein
MYSLEDAPGRQKSLKYAPGVTHEFTCYGIEGGEQIRFDLNMWRQRNLKPVLPASVAFQFVAGSQEEAVAVLQEMLDEVLATVAAPDLSKDWSARFRGSVNITRALRDPDDPTKVLRVVDDGETAAWSSKRARPVNIARRLPRSAVLGAAVVAAGMCGLPSAAEPLDGWGNWGDESTPTMARWLVLDDGRDVPIRIVKLPGVGRRRVEVLTNDTVVLPFVGAMP